MTYHMKNIGKSISAGRKKRGMTQEELAEKLRISAQAVSKWENGIGYPDITLIPAISEALGISLDDLFGATEDIDREAIPAVYEGLALITADGNAAIYADKTAAEIREDGTVVFSDGSTADLRTMTAVNRGAGEIRIYHLDEIVERRPRRKKSDSKYTGAYAQIRNISLSLAHNCEVTICRAADDQTTLEAVGTDTFLSLFSAEAVGETLECKVESLNHGNSQSEENKIIIKTGFAVGNELHIDIFGSSDVRCEVDFNTASFKITGSGDITAPHFGVCDVGIMGSGDVTLSDVSEKLQVGITGAGDFTCGSAKDPQLTVTGAGDITVKDISGEAAVNLTGSGDMTLGGSAHTIRIVATGSGDINASQLTAENAVIRADGPCDITIGRIINGSEEKLSKTSTLKVIKRG